MVKIFDYLDYRLYLRAIFEEKRTQTNGFSHRNLANKLSLKAPGHMLFVVQGKRRLTEAIARRLSVYLKLNRKENDYLLALVSYTDAKSPAEKQYAFEELLSLRQRLSVNVPSSSYRFYEKWYYSAIRAALDVEPFNGDYTHLAGSLCPPIPVSEAREAIELLLDLKMVVKDSEGYLHPAETLISTGDTWQSATIQNLQQQFIDLAKESIDRFNKEDRELSHLTVTISRETYELIKKKVRDLRGQIMAMACAEPHPDRVLQVNIQLFPLKIKNSGVQK